MEPNEELGHWERVYAGKSPRPWRYLQWVHWYYPYRMFDLELRRYVTGRGYRTFLDMGSGPGNWMIYAARRLGLTVFGVDYSERACQLARENLARAGVSGTIIHADFTYKINLQPVDLIYLGGVIEHYADPTEILRIAMRFLNPGGTLVNWLPTSLGLNRWYWKVFDSDRLSTLVAISADDLRRWYEEIGLERIWTVYSGSLCLSMFPKQAILPRPKWLHRIAIEAPVRALDVTLSIALIAMSALGGKLESPLFSPHVIAFGTKSQAHS